MSTQITLNYLYVPLNFRIINNKGKVGKNQFFLGFQNSQIFMNNHILYIRQLKKDGECNSYCNQQLMIYKFEF